MKKFSKLLLRIMDLEKDLAERLVMESLNEDPKAVLTNAAHEEIFKVVQYGYDLLKEDLVVIENQEKPKLKMIK